MEQYKKFYGYILGLKLERTFSPAPEHTIAFFNGNDNGAKIESISGDSILGGTQK